jgi:tetratricopeptide (TPR) repeat protein
LTARPRAGDAVQNCRWHKMHWSGTTEGRSMCGLFDVAGYGFDYAITPCLVYVYSPVDHPKAIFSGSADDALKVVLNGQKIWSNQIQRSPTYDSDQVAAPLKQGWNTVLAVVDQVWGGHLLCARFLDGNQALTDLEISLDPPKPEAKRHPAGPYNKAAADLMLRVDALKLEGKIPEALAACDEALAKFPLADVTPRVAYTRAGLFFDLGGGKSEGQPEKCAAALESVLALYAADLLAEYALLDLGRIQEKALKDPAKAEATYRSFEARYPLSSLAPKAMVELARMLAEQKQYEAAILTFRKVIAKFPQSDEVMTANVGIGDAYRLAGEKDKARKQYAAAAAMAQDWHDNKYGVDVGKQAWLEGLINYLRQQSAAVAP